MKLNRNVLKPNKPNEVETNLAKLNLTERNQVKQNQIKQSQMKPYLKEGNGTETQLGNYRPNRPKPKLIKQNEARKPAPSLAEANRNQLNRTKRK